MSLTEALRTGAPQAFGALYDEYAEPLYAYCYVMVGVEAGDALHDVFLTVARDPDAVPDDDARLPVWLHSLARAQCVRRGALLRGVATTTSTDPLRRALALLSPGHREILALTNALDPEQTAQVLGVTRDAAETLAWDARQRLEEAAAVVRGEETPNSAMLAPLSGEALHRLVTLGYEPPSGQRDRILASCAAAAPPATGFTAAAAPPLDGSPESADDATRQIPAISPDQTATTPLVRPGGTSANTRPDQSVPGEPAPAESGLPAAELAGSGAAAWEAIDAAWAEDASTGEQPPGRGSHAKPKRSSSGRLLPVVALVACVAAATGTAFALTGSHHTHDTSAVVHQSARPTPPAPSPSSTDPASPSPTAATSHASPSPTPARTAPTTAKPRRTTAPARGSTSSTPASPTKTTPTARPTSPPTSTAPAESSPAATPTPSAEPSSPARPTPTAEPSSPARPTPTAEPSKTPKPSKTAKPSGTAAPSKTVRSPHTPKATRTAESPHRPKATHTVRPTRPATSADRPTHRPKPHRTTTSGDGSTGGRGSDSRRGADQTCHGVSDCSQPFPWHIGNAQPKHLPQHPEGSGSGRGGRGQGGQSLPRSPYGPGSGFAQGDRSFPQRSNGLDPGFGQRGQGGSQGFSGPPFAQRPRG
ncbi:hypothetical protein GCM10010151_51120 [Actinoallomurus spadix]|uniref:Uncharacterized protein n=1 Tax=Actinoallomurus spadix TaxID=79912 RepID=A0ABN0X5L1_9ACTN